MRDLPDLIFVVDVRRETTAVKEANKLGIPVIAIVDTNCDPDPIYHIIPANDDAIRAIRLITSKIADAALEGIAQRKAHEPEEGETEEIALEDEKYLSAATLARLKELSFEEEAQASEESIASTEAAAEVTEEQAEETETPTEAEGAEAESSD